MQNNWIEIKVITTSDALEPVSGIFYWLDVKGVAIEDPNDIKLKEQNPLSWDFADYNIFEFGEDAAVVKGYFSEEEDIENLKNIILTKLNELREMGIDVGEGRLVTTKVNEEDWSTSWKKYYKPLKLGDKIVIKPTWEEYSVNEGEIIIELDPGMAFGTGTHETTSMCIGMIEKYLKPGDVVFDIGTGSGILSITSSKLGAGNVVGVDLDEVAVKSATENVATNGLKNVNILHGDLTNVLMGKANIIVANIIAEVVIGLTETIKPFMERDSIFIASGIIRERSEDVLNAMNNAGHRIIEVKEKGEWVAIVTTLK
ncbi:MAG: ribosomal protein methyltransferase [Clostridiales bacterium]|jgi:ribosomal protein L11 methyltransferase|nr:ribosomal protein methyltransferase [Clostridiales bacterium]